MTISMQISGQILVTIAVIPTVDIRAFLISNVSHGYRISHLGIWMLISDIHQFLQDIPFFRHPPMHKGSCVTRKPRLQRRVAFLTIDKKVDRSADKWANKYRDKGRDMTDGCTNRGINIYRPNFYLKMTIKPKTHTCLYLYSNTCLNPLNNLERINFNRLLNASTQINETPHLSLTHLGWDRMPAKAW